MEIYVYFDLEEARKYPHDVIVDNINGNEVLFNKIKIAKNQDEAIREVGLAAPYGLFHYPNYYKSWGSRHLTPEEAKILLR